VVSLGIPLPQPFPNMMNAFSFLSLNFLPLSCLSSNYFNETYFWSALPMIFAIAIVLYFAANSASAYMEKILTAHQSRQQRHLFDRCATYLLMMTYLVLPPVSLKQYQGLDCQSIRGQSFLRINTSINCHSAEYYQFRRLNGICIAAYSAIPPMWLYFLWKQRRRLNPPTSDLRLAYHLRDSDEQLAPLRFLFVPYQPHFYYFEAIEM